MSRSSWLRALPLGVSLAIAGCGSPPPGSVDEEALAADITSCLRDDPTCVRSGPVYPAEMLTTEAVFFGPGAKVSLPLRRPADVTRLIALAMSANPFVPQELANVASTLRFTLRVTVTGAPPVELTTTPILKRLEVDFGGYVPPPGARVELEVVEGYWVFQWIVGRWNR